MKRMFVVLGVLMFAWSMAALAQDVSTDYDHNANFSQFHTCYWAEVKTENPFWEQRIEQAVDKQLQSKRWQRVDNGGDVALTAVGATRNQQECRTFYNNLGPGWWWGGFGSTATTTTTNYRVGYSDRYAF